MSSSQDPRTLGFFFLICPGQSTSVFGKRVCWRKCVNVCMRVRACVRVHACAHSCSHVCARMCVCTCVCARAHECCWGVTAVCVCVCVRARARMNVVGEWQRTSCQHMCMMMWHMCMMMWHDVAADKLSAYVAFNSADEYLQSLG